ncbi:MAG: hypothetical protein IKQ77_10420 [Prevotella sp.]|nr:hypothetical protein [Prevotella sp.]
MKRLLIIFAMALCLLSLSAESIRVGQLNRSYITYVPRNLGTNRPLLISCHGMNQDANYQKGMLKIETVADTAKFVTVFPEGIDRSWDISGNRDINFILALIDEMVEKYSIDPCRVYLSGFSMGGMFTYHAMNKIADRIAAFAPISGYPMGGATANPNVRPIPIIHTHGTTDDVVSFANVQRNLNVWIQHNGCPTTATVTRNYRGTPHITRHVWGPGNEGVEVVLMEMANKGHWISNDFGVLTGDEIWKFCSRYSVDVTYPIEKPVVQIDQRFTSLNEAKGKSFAIVNEEEGLAFHGIDNQNLGYSEYSDAFSDDNSGYHFKLVNSSVANSWLLRLMTPDNTEYSIWGNPGYLNSQPVDGWCCFILGLNNQNGQDIRNGAVWEIEYVDGKGFSLKNVGTGLYLHDSSPAKYDTPKYFTFCTTEKVTGITTVPSSCKRDDGSIYDLLGRRVDGNNLRPGIYIRSGRKFVVK